MCLTEAEIKALRKSGASTTAWRGGAGAEKFRITSVVQLLIHEWCNPPLKPRGTCGPLPCIFHGQTQFLECITENGALIPDHPTKPNAPVGASMRAWRQLRSSGEITPANLTDCPLWVQPNCYNYQDVELHRLTKLREQHPGSPIVEICDMWGINWSEPVKRHARELDIARIGVSTGVTMNVQVLLQVNNKYWFNVILWVIRLPGSRRRSHCTSKAVGNRRANCDT